MVTNLGFQICKETGIAKVWQTRRGPNKIYFLIEEKFVVEKK